MTEDSTPIVNIVWSEATPERLDKVLLSELSQLKETHDITRSKLKAWIEAGMVSVNGKVILKSGTELKAGAKIQVVIPKPESTHLEEFDFALDILFEDDHLIVINKPAGLTVHPGAGNKNTTLANALVGHFKSNAGEFADKLRPGIVHRLDRDTSGVLVVARTPSAQLTLSRQFAKRSTGRIYHAVVLAHPRGGREINRKDYGTIKTNIGRNPHNRLKMSVLEQGGRSAITHWKVLERFDYAALLQVKLETGRTHQIRVHMDHIGAPVLGDKTYGNFSMLPKPLKQATEVLGRQALHASTLEFDHPVTGARLSFSSPLPTDMLNLLQAFR